MLMWYVDQLGFMWALKKGKQSSSEKKAPGKRRKRPNSGPGGSNADKTKKTNTSNANISTKLLSDGTQVIETEEKMTHRDGSTVDIESEEAIKKRTIRLADGTRILETTTKIVTTKVERIVLPSLPTKEDKSGSNTTTTDKRENESQSSGVDEVQPEAEEAPAKDIAVSEPTVNGSAAAKTEDEPIELPPPSNLGVEKGSPTIEEV